MAVVLKGAVKLYYFLNEDIVDPRTREWFLIGSPWPGLALLAAYLLAVFRWLPAHVQRRPAYDLRTTIAVYNALQIVACAYIVYQSLALGWLSHYRLVCQPADGPHALDFAWRVCYGYFVIKLVDLVDTIFFVLRKKQNQISFLHVYHHTGMVIVSWGIVKWVPGGHMTFLLTVNSVVHIIMYGYYLLTVWDESYKRSLWWKKHVTQIQIVQFTLILAHMVSLVVARDCTFPRIPAYLLIPQNLFILILFLDFYYRAYLKNTKTN